MFFFFNDTATTEIYTLSLHDALPISSGPPARPRESRRDLQSCLRGLAAPLPGESRAHDADERDRHPQPPRRSEEHTSELQSRQYLVCRLLLEKKTTYLVTTVSHASQH